MSSLLAAFDGPFATWRGDADWRPWRAFLKALTAQPLDADERALFERCTGRTRELDAPASEAWLVVGRRGRKSATAAMIGVHAAVFGDWSSCLAPGEQGRVLIAAFVKDQARLVRSYCEAILRSRPELEALIESTDRESIALANGIVIQVAASSFRSIRGPSVVCAILDELAIWHSDESANPDAEVIRAVRPAMLTTRKRGALLIGLSSPYAKRGVLWERFRDHHGNDDSRVLVWRADTATMNPDVDPAEIEAAYRDDPTGAPAEYGALFRDDVASFLDAELLEPLTRSSPLELPPRDGLVYRAFVDPSGGRGDAMTLAIAHREGDRNVVDLVRAVPAPFDPAAVVADFAALLRDYRLRETTGDAYSGEWVATAFRDQGIAYRPSPENKSGLYLAALPLFARGGVELPDHRLLLTELARLERRTARGGKDSVDHPRGASDDAANAACGALVLVDRAARRPDFAGLKLGLDKLAGGRAAPWHSSEAQGAPPAYAHARSRRDGNRL